MFIDFRSKNGGGSGDAYSKAETDELLAKKANSTELTEEKGRAEQAEEVLDGKIVANTEAIQNKADKSTTYTKDEVDSALSSKADASDITDIDSKLQSKADSSDVNAIAESLSTTQEIVAQKANIGDSYTKDESDAKYLTEHQDISGKQDVIADLETIREGAALGATAIQEHQSLAEYAKTADMAATYQPKGDYLTSETDPVWNAEKTRYYDKTQVDAKLYNKADASTVYTKSQVDSALSNKTNTSFDNLTTEGKENLKNIIVGSNIEIDESHIVTAAEASLKWTIDFKDDAYTEITLTKDSQWQGVNFSIDGENLNVYGNGGWSNIIRLYRKDNDEQLDIYDGEGYNATTLDNYYIMLTEGYTVTYYHYPRLVSESKGMIEETDPVWNAEKVNYYTKSDVDSALSNKANSSDVYTKNQVNIELAKKANTATTYTKSEVDSKVADIPLKTINGESIKGTGNIVIQGGSGDAYTKAESDALLANKTNTNLDNISEEGKETLKNMFKGNMHTIDFNGSSTHSINSEEAGQKWYINYDNEIFNIWGDFMFSITQTGTFWDIYHNDYGKPEGTVTFRCTGSTEGIEIYDKATDTKISTDADLDLTVDENSFYIKFLDRLYTIRTDYYEYADGLFYSGTAPLIDVYSKSEIQENYYSKNEINQTYATQYYVNNTFEKKSDIEGDVNHYIDYYNFKTINGEDVRGEGDITIQGGGGDTYVVRFNPNYGSYYIGFLVYKNGAVNTTVTCSGELYAGLNNRSSYTASLNGAWYRFNYGSIHTFFTLDIYDNGKQVYGGLFNINDNVVPKSYLSNANNYAELHFFDENENETTLLLLKKN